MQQPNISNLKCRNLAVTCPSRHGKFVLQPASRASESARIFHHLKVIEKHPRVANQFSHFLCYAVGVLGFYKADNEAMQSGNVLGAMSCPNAAAIFVVVPVNHVVATVFNAPMFAIGFKDFLGIRLLGRATGQPVTTS
jgi:hypothetical protein